MVVLTDPPAHQAATAPRKRGGEPRTPRGRMRSRENSVREWFRSKVVFSRDMAGRILERNLHLQNAFNPKTRYELMFVADMALAKARIDRATSCRSKRQPVHRAHSQLLGSRPEDAGPGNAKTAGQGPRGFNIGSPGSSKAPSCSFRSGPGWPRPSRRPASGIKLKNHYRLILGAFGPSCGWGIPCSPHRGQSPWQPRRRGKSRLREMKETWLDALDEEQQDDGLEGLAPDDDATTKRLRRYERMSIRDYDKAHAELVRMQADREERFKHIGFETTLRPWDVDCLLERLKGIQDPPLAADDFEAEPHFARDAKRLLRPRLPVHRSRVRSVRRPGPSLPPRSLRRSPRSPRRRPSPRRRAKSLHGL